MDSPFKIDVDSTNFPCGISTSNRWRIDEDVSIGTEIFFLKPLFFCVQVTFLFNAFMNKDELVCTMFVNVIKKARGTQDLT